MDTTDPAAPLDDLAPVGEMVGDAVIVGLGESTHGARQEWLLKHRMLRFLVEEKGFRSIAWEEDWTNGLKVNEFIRTGAGDPEAIVRETMIDTWRAREIADVLRWLRDYNAGRDEDDQVQFVGVEFFATGLVAYDAVEARVAEVAPEQLPALQERLELIRPETDDIGQHLREFQEVDDKEAYVRAACEVLELVKGLRHEGGENVGELAVHHARQIRSFYEHFTLPFGSNEQLTYRDERAAENLRWWQERTGDKVADWASSGHTANAPGLQLSRPPQPEALADSAGSHLRRWYGERYLSVGFTFDHGAIAGDAVTDDGGQPLPVPSPPPDWADHPLGEVGLDQFVLDLRADAPAASGLAGGPHPDPSAGRVRPGKPRRILHDRRLSGSVVRRDRPPPGSQPMEPTLIISS